MWLNSTTVLQYIKREKRCTFLKGYIYISVYCYVDNVKYKTDQLSEYDGNK